MQQDLGKNINTSIKYKSTTIGRKIPILMIYLELIMCSNWVIICVLLRYNRNICSTCKTCIIHAHIKLG